jgi:hypothetical protein
MPEDGSPKRNVAARLARFTGLAHLTVVAIITAIFVIGIGQSHSDEGGFGLLFLGLLLFAMPGPLALQASKLLQAHRTRLFGFLVVAVLAVLFAVLTLVTSPPLKPGSAGWVYFGPLTVLLWATAVAALWESLVDGPA